MAKKTTGQRVRQLRTEQGMTREKLAVLSGVSHATIVIIEKDAREVKASTRLAVARALGVDDV